MSGFDERNLLPSRNAWRCHVVPCLSSIDSQMNQAVIGSAPDAVRIERRRRNSVNHAASSGLLGRVGLVFSDAHRQIVPRSRQIRADFFPVIAAVACLPERVSSEEKQMRIERRKDDRLGAQNPENHFWTLPRKY